jgi:hypothetical protein
MARDSLTYLPAVSTREEATRYVRRGTSLFDRLVEEGRMPKPRSADRARKPSRAALFCRSAGSPLAAVIRPQAIPSRARSAAWRYRPAHFEFKRLRKTSRTSMTAPRGCRKPVAPGTPLAYADVPVDASGAATLKAC